ncbi:hypothetical protein NHX12_008697 [Muraenolepis orangiensis]|uniref:Calsyntenin C-terminal domain-containing protein n=1 Tax=Muraenolepis orangiensis TaxID=630683 RepID=A0A9Q0DNK4_9TELE|nr:hypothetical protein NHX12_008697 [Muraenolepis orangiensis]
MAPTDPLSGGTQLNICDKERHYYVINVEFPVVTLYVDGVTYDPYLVTDDWSIHPSQIDVQLTMGACWQGVLSAATVVIVMCIAALVVVLGIYRVHLTHQQEAKLMENKDEAWDDLALSITAASGLMSAYAASGPQAAHGDDVNIIAVSKLTANRDKPTAFCSWRPD